LTVATVRHADAIVRYHATVTDILDGIVAHGALPTANHASAGVDVDGATASSCAVVLRKSHGRHDDAALGD
jgi:hypothetical protein